MALAALALSIGASVIGGTGTASADIHPIVESLCAAQDSHTGAGQDRNPPGQSDNPATGVGMPHEGFNHPWVAHTPDEARSGEGTAHCTNPLDD